MSKGKRLLISGMILAVIAAVFYFFFNGFSLSPQGKSPEKSSVARPKKTVAEKTRPEQSAVMVTVAKVELKSVQRTVEVVGTFEGYEEITVTPKVDGRVVRINYDVGDIVHPGDVLLEIDPTDYQLAVQEARKKIESELAKDGLTALPGPGFDIMKLPTVVRALNEYRNSAARFSRVDSLYKQKISTKEDWDQAYTDHEVAKATVEQAKIEAETHIAKAREQAAILATAEQRLRDTKVEAPTPSAAIARLAKSPKDIEYAVDKRWIDEGEMAGRTNPQGVFDLVIDKLLKFKASVPEVYTSQVKLGQKVQLHVDAYPEKIFEGKVSRISPTVDRLSRTFQIEVLVPNLSRELKPGGFAKGSILTKVDASAKTVPLEALITSVGTTKIFVVRDGKAHAVEVKTGVSENQWVEITSDLDPSSRIITSGQNQLTEGVAVKIR
ncbi:MAG: efflux RND transporter periplasmic adaptor subunit [Thermoguttaceae bacterium]